VTEIPFAIHGTIGEDTKVKFLGIFRAATAEDAIRMCEDWHARPEIIARWGGKAKALYAKDTLEAYRN